MFDNMWWFGNTGVGAWLFTSNDGYILFDAMDNMAEARDIIVGGRPDVVLVYPRGSKELIAGRMAARQGHFMPSSLLDSQFATLEEPSPDENAVVVPIDQPAGEITGEIVRRLAERGLATPH